MNNFYTYELCSSETPWLPFYIGKGKDDRMYVHEGKALKNTLGNKHLQRKILKILKEGNTIYYHKFNDNVSEEDALACEIVAIATFKNAGVKLCNITDGGEGGDWFTNNPRKEEIRKNMSKSGKGRISPFKNKHHTEETKNKQRIAYKNRLPISEETKKKISKATKGKNNPMYNKHHTKETRQKISKSLRGKILNRNAWNKGLTKETDLRVKCCSESISKSWKNREK
jgi:hypothetical protein